MAKGDGLTMDDPLFRKMKEIIWSAEGQTSVKEAIAAGLPGVTFVDLLLQIKLPNQYRATDDSNRSLQLPAQVGFIVINMVKEWGYTVLDENAPCPTICVARSGKTFKPKG